MSWGLKQRRDALAASSGTFWCSNPGEDTNMDVSSCPQKQLKHQSSLWDFFFFCGRFEKVYNVRTSQLPTVTGKNWQPAPSKNWKLCSFNQLLIIKSWRQKYFEPLRGTKTAGFQTLNSADFNDGNFYRQMFYLRPVFFSFFSDERS